VRQSGSSIVLDWCEDEYTDSEIFLGFDLDKEFKLIPKTLPDDCLTQEHYPTSGETISAQDCDNACDDATCLWEAIYVSNDDEENGAFKNSAPSIEDNGDGYCTEDEPCARCVGDCDMSSECIGDLICCKRGRYDRVPTCSGGEDNGSSKFLLVMIDMYCRLLDGLFYQPWLGRLINYYSCLFYSQRETFASLLNMQMTAYRVIET
jgi:hypothetical protein